MKNLWIAASLVLSVAAQANPVVITSSDHIVPLVELYTSEGCSSCPPADKAITILGENLNEDLQATLLSFHVDYWDYLGWKDIYAKSQYTKRQREKAAVNQQQSIYTPEFMVGGKEIRGGSGRLVDVIKHNNQQPAEVALTIQIERIDNTLDMDVEVNNQSGKQVRLQAAIFENQLNRKIKGGENKGRTISYNYVVRELTRPITVKRNQSTHRVKMAIPADAQLDNTGVAVFVENLQLQTLQSVSARIQ